MAETTIRTSSRRTREPRETLPALRDDALSSTSDGFELHLGLPWIRSLPLSSLDGLQAVSYTHLTLPTN